MVIITKGLSRVFKRLICLNLDHESDDQEEVEDSEEDEEASTTSEATKDEKDTAR